MDSIFEAVDKAQNPENGCLYSRASQGTDTGRHELASDRCGPTHVNGDAADDDELDEGAIVGQFGLRLLFAGRFV